jgi:glycosyltransferase involved in cell wall biosynthesis
VCVTPSLALEGFGLVVIEALACGTPVVVTDVGGLPEAVAGLGRDVVVPAGEHEALARRLSAARDGSAPLPSPAQCRTHAERFTWDEAVRRHRQVYVSAITRKPRTRARVVYLDHCAELSGGELALATTLRALRRVDAHVILAQDGPLVSLLTQAGISVEVLPMGEVARGLARQRFSAGRLPIAAGLHSGRYVAKLALRLRRLRPDLVHANSLKAAIYGLPAARSVGIPAIWHLREHLTPECLPRAALRLMRVISRLPSAIVANSVSSRATLPEVRCPVEIIMSPVRLPPARQPRSAPNGSGALRVGVVGRVAPIKGQHLFLDAFARAFPDGGDCAVLIGAPLFGEVDYERSLHHEVSRLGLEGRVSFRGFREDIEHELSQLDVLVLSSIVPEGLGQSAIEGMAAGLPVVVPDIGGPPEVVRDGVNGLIYRAGDPEAMAEALRRLKRDPLLRRRLGANGPQAVAFLSPEAVASRLEEFYARVLATPAGPPQA